MSDQNGGEKRPNSSNKRGGRQGRSRHNNRSHRGGQNRKPKRYGGVSKAVLMERNAEQITAMEDKANRRFERKEPPMGFPDDLKEPNTHHFTWTTLPVPLKDEEALAKLVLRKGEFGWLDDERVDELAKIVEPHSMNLDQALSLRSALMQQKTVYGHGRLRSRAKEMLRLYKEGVSVVDLSQRFDGPPMNVFRLILAEMRWSKTKIKESLREPSRLSKRERKEFETAEAADRVSNVDQGESQEKADLFEDVLADWFEEQGVRLRRQPEMVKEQKQELGRPVRTPDILFLDHVYINDRPVAWIDAKHFYGADVEFQRKKMAKQMDRYIEEWGSGAVVYRHGFSENLFMPGCTLLDASVLDLSAFDANG
ncbi:C15orf41 family protein [Candidatus Poseidoniales archaeon]|nr:C15orf41 family protein [Candidatus Poseidoniales archaeon]MDB2322652.1 C15orf41 family protein [Candidatus Poseidoniales archaeon]